MYTGNPQGEDTDWGLILQLSTKRSRMQQSSLGFPIVKEDKTNRTSPGETRRKALRSPFMYQDHLIDLEDRSSSDPTRRSMMIIPNFPLKAGEGLCRRVFQEGQSSGFRWRIVWKADVCARLTFSTDSRRLVKRGNLKQPLKSFKHT